MTGRMNQRGDESRHRWRKWLWGTGGAILLAAALAMAVSDEVSWGPGDFGFATALVIGAGGSLELLARMDASRTYRAAAGVAVVTAVLLIWSNAALGVVGSDGNPANLMFFGLPAVGLAGALVARLRPNGMARSMFATALAQLAAGLIGLIALGPMPDVGPALDILGLTMSFAGLWLLSAWLFRKAAQEQGLAGASPRA